MYELIEHKKLTSSTASFTFTNIPQIYTDLYLLTSLRDDTASTGWENAFIYPNGSSANMVSRMAYGWGDNNYGSGVNVPAVLYHQVARGGNTASTFSNSSVYITNYKASTAKSFSAETSVERNHVAGINSFAAGLWSSSDAITSLQISAASGNFVAGSSATLYGVNRTQALGRPSQPKAIGGNITFANGYWVHTFTGSGSLIVNQDVTAEYLVIAGGGGSTFASAGGGGAGGYRSSVQGELSGGGATAEAPIFLSKNQTYAVTIGAGGIAGANNQTMGGNGSNSSFGSITSTGGGGGSGQSINFPSVPAGASGGSGGGGARNGITPGSGTSGQGYAGGNGTNSGNSYAGGGGGGAGGVGGAADGSKSGNGGVGLASSITGTSVLRAGGGSGSLNEGTIGTAEAGGGLGGRDSLPGVFRGQNGTANTGGGAGGGAGVSEVVGGAVGGSGVVIVRYKAD